MRTTYRHGSQTYDVTIAPGSDEGRYDVTVGDVVVRVAASVAAGGAALRVHDGACERTAVVSRIGAFRSVSLPGIGDATLERVVRGARRERGSGAMASPMPGKVVAVRVAVGDEVTAGQVVAVVEAMKMEMPLTAPRAGRVATIAAQVGEMVDAGMAVVELEAEAS